jgi:propane 2-monooxygenase small subunit
VMQAAALHGDYVTPSLMGKGESDATREQRGARALFGMLANDEKHGEENRATMQDWLSNWTATSVAAAQQLQPIWSQLPEKVVRFEDSYGRSRERFESLLGDLSLETPKELNA